MKRSFFLLALGAGVMVAPLIFPPLSFSAEANQAHVLYNLRCCLNAIGYTEVQNSAAVTPDSSVTPRPKYYYISGNSVTFTDNQVVYENSSYYYWSSFRYLLTGTSYSGNRFVCTGLFWFNVSDAPQNRLNNNAGAIVIAVNSFYKVENGAFTDLGSSDSPNVLPLKYHGGPVTTVQMYPVNNRTIVLDDSFLSSSNAVSQCEVARHIMYGTSSQGSAAWASRVYNTTISLNVPGYSNYQTYDYDQGGEIDIFEWASNRDRLNPADDSPNCTEELPEPDQETGTQSQQVEVGPETQAKYQTYTEALTTQALGSGVDTPSVNSFYASGTSYAPAYGLDRISGFQSSIESAMNQNGAFGAMDSLKANLSSGQYPSFSVPSASVNLSGTRSGGVEVDLSDVKLDFGVIQQNSDFRSIFSVGRLIAAFALYVFTGWRVWRLFTSLLSDNAPGDIGTDND